MMAAKENPAACDSVPGQKLTDVAIVAHCEVNSKRFANLAARAAIAGHQLHQTAGGFMLARWNHSRHCGDLDTVEVLLHRMGA